MEIQKIKDYIDKHDIELNSDFNLPKKNDEEMDLHDIGSDMIVLSDVFLIFFAEFRRKLYNYDKKIINEYEEIAKDLLSLKNYKYDLTKYGKSASVKFLIKYVNDNYFKIYDFVALCWEVFEL